jgi:hypothetical protein
VNPRLVSGACVLALVGAGLVGGVDASGTVEKTSTVSSARLRLTVTTTSNWTELRLRPTRRAPGSR